MRRGRAQRRLSVWLAPLMVLALAACNTGAYPFDILPEMHYTSSFRAQESPRLQPPSDSVPVTGRELPIDFAAATGLASPFPAGQVNMGQARALFQTNCSMCHGPAGKGDGPVGDKFAAAGAPRPVDFSQPRTKGRKEGELFWIITNGLGNMPAFKNLISESDRWLLVAFVRQVQ